MQEHIHRGVPQVRQVEGLVTRNLQFLSLIEHTIDRVCSDTAHIRVMAGAVAQALADIQKIASPRPFDPEGKLTAQFEETAETVRRIYAHITQAHDSACRDSNLDEDDGVVEAFEEQLEALADLHTCTEELRHWIENHNALLEPTTGKSYKSAKDLIAALRAD